MTVFPDGHALSEWEAHILEDIEGDLEVSDPRLAALLSRHAPTPLHGLAVCIVAADAVAALTALTLTVAVAGTISGLAMIGTFGTRLLGRAR